MLTWCQGLQGNRVIFRVSWEGFGVAIWHGKHFLTIESTTLSILGNQTFERYRLRVLTIPWWPSWTNSTTRFRYQDFRYHHVVSTEHVFSIHWDQFITDNSKDFESACVDSCRSLLRLVKSGYWRFAAGACGLSTLWSGFQVSTYGNDGNPKQWPRLHALSGNSASPHLKELCCLMNWLCHPELRQHPIWQG